MILHVEDLASSCFDYKRKTVINTLENLGKQLGANSILDKVMTVGNKCDLVENKDIDIMMISAKNKTGMKVI